LTWYMPVLRIGDRWLAHPLNGIRCQDCKDGYYAHANTGTDRPFPLCDDCSAWLEARNGAVPVAVGGTGRHPQRDHGDQGGDTGATENEGRPAV
jgi:hypothetical protein